MEFATKLGKCWSADIRTLVRYWLYNTLRPLCEQYALSAPGNVVNAIVLAMATTPIDVHLDTRHIWLFGEEWACFPLHMCSVEQCNILRNLLKSTPCPFRKHVSPGTFRIRYTHFSLNAIVDANMPRVEMVRAFVIELCNMFSVASSVKEARSLSATAMRLCARSSFFSRHPTRMQLLREAENVSPDTEEKKRNIYPSDIQLTATPCRPAERIPNPNSHPPRPSATQMSVTSALPPPPTKK